MDVLESMMGISPWGRTDLHFAMTHSLGLKTATEQRRCLVWYRAAHIQALGRSTLKSSLSIIHVCVVTQQWGEQLWPWSHCWVQKLTPCALPCPWAGLHRSVMHICVWVHICACTLVGGSQPLMDQSSADSFSQLLNLTFANYSYPKGRNTMIKQLCLSRATKHAAQQEALILDIRMKKSDTLPLLPMTAGGGRTQKLCASRQPRGDVRLLPLLPSLLITGAESLSHSEPKGLIMHPGNKTTGWEGSLLEAICSKTNHKSGRCEFFASNLLAQASTKQTINVRQPDIPEKRVMSCTSLVALTLAGHPRGSSSTTI